MNLCSVIICEPSPVSMRNWRAKGFFLKYSKIMTMSNVQVTVTLEYTGTFS